MLDWLRPALSGLTTRGRSFLAAGAASALCAVLLGQRDLLRVAVMLVALPLGCALMLARARYRLSLTRTVTPVRVTAGSTARVRLELQNLTRLSTRMLLAEDRVPYALGAPPRFVLDRLPGGRMAAVTYSLRSEVRGRYPVGPLRLRLTDPFGMCELTRSFTATDSLVVVPKIWPLGPVTAGGLWAGTGDSLTRSAAASGHDDVAVREYRQGDDLRRVHWRSTARRGDLMVRREEQPRQMRATVLLDCRTDAHRGEGPASSFEWAVSAAASAAVHLAERGFAVRVLTDSHAVPWTRPFSADTGRLLDDLAVATLGGRDELGAALSLLLRTGGDGLVVAVLGEAGEDMAVGLARLAHSGSPGIALLLRTTAWMSLPPGRAAAIDEQRDRVAGMLGAAGWRVAEAGPADIVSTVWAQANGLPANLAMAGGSRAGRPRPAAGGGLR
jgi:uncharacterized protein (DUF58 family)